jgi:hypothetical protein
MHVQGFMRPSRKRGQSDLTNLRNVSFKTLIVLGLPFYDLKSMDVFRRVMMFHLTDAAHSALSRSGNGSYAVDQRA